MRNNFTVGLEDIEVSPLPLVESDVYSMPTATNTFKATKRPVEVECIEFTGSNAVECLAFMGQVVGDEQVEELIATSSENGLRIETLEDGKNGEAIHIASVGDIIIKGVEGEFYPCKPDIFEKTYVRAGVL